jgi:hypothetical protein
MRSLPAAFLFSSLVLLLLTSCGPALTVEELRSSASLYAARMAFAWENLSVFQMRGRASVRDGNLLANGPFVMWGSLPDSLLRGDFYGPDGRPVLSIRVDRSGTLVYSPSDETALFCPGGIPVGGGSLPSTDLLHLIRTGFPLQLEQWQVADGAEVTGAGAEWRFSAAGCPDTLRVVLEPGDLFPELMEWDGGSAGITGSTWHDEFNAWPESWVLTVDGSGTVIEVTRLYSPAEPWEGLWNLCVPVPVDTLDVLPPWEPAWEIPEH